MTDNEELALTVSKQEAKKLVGKLCTALESFGLPRPQEEATKRVVKDCVWGSHGLIEAALRGQYIGTGERL